MVELCSLSDELLLLIIVRIPSKKDLGNFRLSCKHLCNISDEAFWDNITVTLDEQDNKYWDLKIRFTPEALKGKIKGLTIANNCRVDDSRFFENTITDVNSTRLTRWNLMYTASKRAHQKFKQSAIFRGVEFNPSVKPRHYQFMIFRWLHGIPLALRDLVKLLSTHSKSLSVLEMSMIQPPSLTGVARLEEHTTKHMKDFKLKRLAYYGLSYTEPNPLNDPPPKGRFRMIRPIFQITWRTVEELILSQDHCISQIGRTPFINGHNYETTLCDLNEILYDPPGTSSTLEMSSKNASLDLKVLELSGFEVSEVFRHPALSSDIPQNRVTIDPSKLNRLVLQDCYGLSDLFSNLAALPHGQIKLRELGLRCSGSPMTGGDHFDNAIIPALRAFLAGGQKLEVLSFLLQGDNASKADVRQIIRDQLPSLKAVVLDRRDPTTLTSLPFVNTNETDTDLSDWYLPTQIINSSFQLQYSTSLGPQLKEIALNCIHSHALYSSLQCLSQYRGLRTVHIRNFPTPEFGVDGTRTCSVWRTAEGGATSEAVSAVRKVAESIALPSFNEPEADALKSPYHEQCIRLARQNIKHRQETVFGGVSLDKITSCTPVRNLTSALLHQRSKIDPTFCMLKYRVDHDSATPGEKEQYDRIHDDTAEALGFVPPTIKPSLKLLIIGDWSYRDQFNLTGPRSWDPKSWCTAVTEGDEPDEDDSDVEQDEWSESGNICYHHGKKYNMPDDFKRERDVRLLPIFFEISWKVSYDDETSKFRWKADATELKNMLGQDRYGILSDVRTLDFAWQD